MNLSPLAYLAQESSCGKVGFTIYLAVGGLLVSYLPTYLVFSVKWREDSIIGIELPTILFRNGHLSTITQ
jgi:hypothetical protein